MSEYIKCPYHGINDHSCRMRHRGMDNCALIDSIEYSSLELKPFFPEIIKILKPKELWLSGDEIKRRAGKHNAHLGQWHADYLSWVTDPENRDTRNLQSHEKAIPEEWQKYNLFFPGTVWRNAEGHEYVPYLHFWYTWWLVEFRWLNTSWYPKDRFVRIRR